MRTLAVLTAVVALSVPPLDAFAALRQGHDREKRTVKVVKVVKVLTVVGPAEDADVWGPVKVNASIRRVKIDGKLVSQRITRISVPVFPHSTPRSEVISDDAFPDLVKAAIAAQGAEVDDVSGATLSSEAFRASLTAALKRVAFVPV